MSHTPDQFEFMRARSRNSDPGTSHAAASAASEFDSKHFDRIAVALSIGGLTAYEVAAVSGLEYAQVHKRLPEMERMVPPTAALVVDAEGNVLTRKGPKGRACRLWRKP